MGILLQRHYKNNKPTLQEEMNHKPLKKSVDLTKRYKKNSLKGMGFVQVDENTYSKDGEHYLYAGGYLKPVEE